MICIFHFFDYVNDPFKHGTYPTPRFVSAYGIQSYPKVESFLKDTNDTNDLNFTGTFLHNRQHLPDGFGIMKKLIAHQIIMKPSNDLEKYARTFSYYSQVIQAYGMRIQTERYRSYRSIKTKDGLGRTMGALYWHFNDVWTAPTWSGIDYFGEWKMLQYYVKEFFSPIIVTGQLEEEENGKTKLDIFVVSDFDKIENADVKIKLGKWNEIGIFNETSFSVSVDASSSKLVQTIDTKKLFSDRGCTKEDCFIYLTLEANGKLIAPNNFILPNPLKNCNLAQPSLKHHLRKLPYVQIYEIIINTDKNALFVWLDAHGIDGRFSENGFLQTTPSKQVFFYSSVDTNENELRKILTVVHVNDKSLQ